MDQGTLVSTPPWSADRAAGIAAFAGGFVSWWLYMGLWSLYQIAWLVLPGLACVVGMNAMLLSTRWRALLIVPIASWLGFVAAVLLNQGLLGNLTRSAGWGVAWEWGLILLVLALLPSLLGAALGALVRNGLPRLPARRATTDE